MGDYHKSLGKENEDAIKVVVNGDYFYCVISDGAGCSDYAKEAAWCTVNTTADFCYNNGQSFFTDKRKETAKSLIFDIQQALYDKAKELGTELSEMMCTLVLLCLNTKAMQYTTVHIGDGLIAQMSNGKTSVISYPENGLTKQFTYFINSKTVFNHMRVYNSEFVNNGAIILSSDGTFENYSEFDIFQNKKKGININSILNQSTHDDATYCIIDFDKI